MIKKQENPLTTESYREVTEKPEAATLTLEYQAYLIVQSNNRTRIAKKRSKKLIQQFDNQPNKESFLQDLNKTEKINPFSEESKELITDMGNTEIFELCETSSKKQCSDCNLYREIGIVYCSCGRCVKPSQSTKKLDKKNFVTSSKRTSTVVPNMEIPNVLQSHGDVAESSLTQTWWVQNHFGKMGQRRQIPQVFVRNWVD